MEPGGQAHRDGAATNAERLVERYRTVGLHLTWHPPTRRLLATQPMPAPAEVIDVSVGGALLLAPYNRRLRPGSVVQLELDGSRGRVRVRHIHQALDPDERYYGVMFLHLQPRLRARVFETVAKHRGSEEHLELLWRSAR